MNDIVNRLQKQISLPRTFFEYCTCVSKSVPIDFAGLAQLSPDGQQFEVIAEWDSETVWDLESHPEMSAETRRFDRVGTVGDHVLRTGEIFVGPTVEAVTQFSGTSEFLQERGFSSNYVTPLGGDAGRVMYMLSRSSGGLNHESTAEVEGSLTYLVELLDVAMRLQTLHDYERALNGAMAEFLSAFVSAQGRYPKLGEVEGAYLRHLSHSSRFRVEGLLGGASLSGLKPSTLRYRLERLESLKRYAPK